MKKAFMFPGQGSQYVGMAKDLYQNEIVKEIFDIANRIIDHDIVKIMFEGPDEVLKESKNAQIAILLHSYALYKLISENTKPDIVCGHSLGEYSALLSAGVLSFEDTLKIVYKRGELMSEAGYRAKGAMAAVIGMNLENIENIIDSIDDVIIANYNGPMQTVISGSESAVNNAIELLNEKGARRVVKLNVSGAFHSPLMNYAYEEFSEFINQFEFKFPLIDVVLNVTGKIEKDAEKIKQALKEQIIKPVKWTDIMNVLINENIEEYYEIGPGKVLSGMIKRLARDKKIINIEKNDDLK